MESNSKSKNIIGVCGILCSTCPAFIATQNCDETLKMEIAKKGSLHYNFPLDATDILCDGCQSPTGRLFRFCKACKIRSCHRLEGNDVCYKCHQFPCNKIINLTDIIPEGKMFMGN